MNTWQRLLRDHDPAFTPHDARLDPDAAGELRAAVVAAAARQQPAPRNWRQPLAMAAVVALMIGAGVVAGHRLDPVSPTPAPVAAIDEPGEPRQLQFATPGGTRIIWVFNPEFDLKETIP